MTTKLSDLETTGDSISLTNLGEKPFNIIAVEDSDYTDKDTKVVSEGVKITTKESVEKDGVSYNVFHTTRKAVVSKLKGDEIRAAIANNDLGPVKCVSTVFGNGKTGFKLEDA